MKTIYIVTRTTHMGLLPTHMVKEKSHETALIRYFLFQERDETFICEKKKNPGHKEVSQTVTCSYKITFFTWPDKKYGIKDHFDVLTWRERWRAGPSRTLGNNDDPNTSQIAKSHCLASSRSRKFQIPAHTATKLPQLHNHRLL